MLDGSKTNLVPAHLQLHKQLAKLDLKQRSITIVLSAVRAETRVLWPDLVWELGDGIFTLSI